MIPAKFEYHRPETVAEATDLLSRLGDDARPLAGGHSLIPMMKLRLASPAHLVDLQSLKDLRGIRVGAERVILGAMVDLNEVISNERLAATMPIFREAAQQIADPQVRYCGTVGGNVANGDPGNDLPAVMMCLDASYELAGAGGAVRIVAARDFHLGAFETAREDNEILTRISIPTQPEGTGYAYEKQKRKIGDYATAAAAVRVGEKKASVVMTNLADKAVWSEAAGAALAARDVDGCVAAALAEIDPQEDMRGPIEFKKHVAGVVLRRAIERALDGAS